MQNLSELVDQSIADFLKASALAGVVLQPCQIDAEILSAPHIPPTNLPAGRMAVYAFFLSGKALKVGKAGPKSQARYSYQHYNPGSAGSTLAASLTKNPGAAGLNSVEVSDVGQWIRENTDRINLLIPKALGDPVLSLLEAFLHVRWMPVHEGRA